MSGNESTVLESAALELETRLPGGGGPPDFGDPGDGGGGGGDDNEGNPGRKKEALYRLGMMLTLASIAALFIALILVFWLRSRSAFLWQPVEVPRGLWVSTAILAISSWMLELSRHALVARQWFAYRRRLLLTIYLGIGFFVCQSGALYQLAEQGLGVRGNPHSAVFYVFTGAHALHLVLGVGGLSYQLTRRGRDWWQHRILASSVAMYWHFMGVLWFALFVLLLAM